MSLRYASADQMVRVNYAQISEIRYFVPHLILKDDYI